MATQYLHVQNLANAVASNPTLQKQISEDPAGALRSLAAQDVPDTWVYRLVVGALGLTVILALVGAIILALRHGNGDIPDVLTALGSAAVGALAGLLAPSPAVRG